MKRLLRRYRWHILATLGLLVLLGLGRLILLTRVIPTDDALYDRYQSAVLKKLRWQAELPVLSLPDPGKPDLPLSCHLADVELARWEGEFGDDPRYWELRYFNAVTASGNPLFGFDTDLNSPDSYLSHPVLGLLARAEERGVDDEHLRARLLPHKLRCLNRYYGNKYDDKQTSRQTIALTVEYEAAERELLDSAVADSPGNAWPDYDRWQHEASYGFDDELFAMLNAANAKPCPLRIPFPCSFVAENLPHSRSGNPLVSGSVLEAWMQLELNSINLIKVKDRCKELEIASPPRGFEASADAIWHMVLQDGYLRDISYPGSGLAICNVVLGQLQVDQAWQLEAYELSNLRKSQSQVEGAMARQLMWNRQAMLEYPLAFYEVQNWTHGQPGFFRKTSSSDRDTRSVMQLAWQLQPGLELNHGAAERYPWRLPLVRYSALTEMFASHERFMDEQFMPYVEALREVHIGIYDERAYNGNR